MTDGAAEARLPTHLWVGAHLRRCSTEAVPAYVLRKGEATGGLVLLRLARPAGGVRVLVQTRDLDGRLGWMAVLGGGWVADAEADAYVARAVDRDPDLWVVEIEHPDGWHPFEGPVF
ncbi:MAG: DUF1491 family protein [Deinococcus-Thermus bacterium]|jgi:hypothetical protein|nr:DUF1491 family protein [Deinococcota bacterium]